MRSDRRAACVLCLVATTLAGCYDGDPSGFREAVVVNREGVTALVIDGGLPVIEVGSALQLAATATTSSGSKDLANWVTWSSSNPSAVVVDARGRITAVANGTAQVSAQLAQFSDTVTVAASNATLQSVAVAGNATVDECSTATYAASGHYDDGSDRDITSLVSWTVGDATVARMSTLAGERNTLFGKLAGTTGLSATRSGIVSPLFTVTVADNLDALVVTPAAPPQIPLAGNQQFTATGSWGAVTADISRAATWSIVNDDTSVEAIAAVANGDTSAGLVSAGSIGGSGTLTAGCGGRSDDVAITVVHLDTLTISNTRPIEIDTAASLLLVLEGTYSDGSTKPLNESATWTVTMVNGSGVTVSNAVGTRGRVTAGSDAAVATVTASVGGKSVAVSVSVIP